MQLIFWWKDIIQIRTEIIRNIRQHDGLYAVLVVEGYYNAIIIEIDGIDEAVNQPLAMLQLRQVQRSEGKQPEADFFFRQYRMPDFLLQERKLQLLFFGLQRVKPLFRCPRKGSGRSRSGRRHKNPNRPQAKRLREPRSRLFLCIENPQLCWGSTLIATLKKSSF